MKIFLQNLANMLGGIFISIGSSPKTGQIIPHLLLPKTLSTDEKMIVSYLEKQIRKFPENSFGP